MTHICVSNLIIIGSDNGLSPCRRQAIIWTNAGILLIGSLGTTFSEILNEMLTFWFIKMRLKVSSAKWRPFCLGLNVLTQGSLLFLLSNGYQLKWPTLPKWTNLSGLLLADWKWLPPIVITFNTLCLVKFYIQWCGALHWTRWRLHLKQLICPYLAS